MLKQTMNLVMVCTPFIPAFRGRGRSNPVSFMPDHRASSRTAKATQRNPVSKQNQNQTSKANNETYIIMVVEKPVK